MSTLHLALYSFGSSLTPTGSSIVLEWLETIANSSHFINGSESDLVEKWPSGQAILASFLVINISYHFDFPFQLKRKKKKTLTI